MKYVFFAAIGLVMFGLMLFELSLMQKDKMGLVKLILKKIAMVTAVIPLDIIYFRYLPKGDITVLDELGWITVGLVLLLINLNALGYWFFGGTGGGDGGYPGSFD